MQGALYLYMQCKVCMCLNLCMHVCMYVCVTKQTKTCHFCKIHFALEANRACHIMELLWFAVKESSNLHIYMHAIRFACSWKSMFIQCKLFMMEFAIIYLLRWLSFFKHTEKYREALYCDEYSSSLWTDWLWLCQLKSYDQSIKHL